MPNRQLNAEELQVARKIFADVKRLILKSAGGDEELAWAIRRKVTKELGYAERGGPNERRKLKTFMRLQQKNLCAACGFELPIRGPVLDRLEAMKGYKEGNVRVICHDCDRRIQEERGFK